MAAPKPKQTAAEAYATRAAEIDAQLKRLAQQLAAHRRDHEANPRNWGLPGDLSHVHEILQEAIDFLGTMDIVGTDDDLHCEHSDGVCRTEIGLECDEEVR